jgi:formyltetrahydrofolate deformylase
MISTRLLVSCPDQPGIVSAIATFLYERGANIVDSAQHSTDPEDGTFLMRMEFVDIKDEERVAFEESFDQEVARRFSMEWRFSYARERKRIGILVSRSDHCLLDLLWRWRRDELEGEIVHVVSNHPDLEEEASIYGLPYTCIPVPNDGKVQAEHQLLQLLGGRVDVLVLARYMQILSGTFLNQVAVPIINIHHSFLPAFVGADPYRRALERGVKIIGATAHYVTEQLDDGPIIAQGVEPVSHRHDLEELERIGRDIERVTLARAVKLHLEDRVIVHGNKTFVFD